MFLFHFYIFGITLTKDFLQELLQDTILCPKVNVDIFFSHLRTSLVYHVIVTDHRKLKVTTLGCPAVERILVRNFLEIF
jgi:hypothetical protein